ncbi:MAG: hypothetical protein C4344_05960, partial [Acidimicrobiia bacterium]
LACDIERLARELARAGVAHLVAPLLGPWRAWCRLAGLHLVDLDVRTRSEVVVSIAHEALASVDRSFAAGDLGAVLAAPLPSVARAEQIQLLDALAAWREAAIAMPDLRGSFVLSGCSGPLDSVAGLWLLRRHAPLDRRIRIAPLFEDADALTRCGAILAAAFDLPDYLRSLKAHGGVQEVTFGYSDTIKESGYLSGHLRLRSAHSAIATACDTAGVTPFIFHGRGRPWHGEVGRPPTPCWHNPRGRSGDACAGPSRGSRSLCASTTPSSGRVTSRRRCSPSPAPAPPPAKVRNCPTGSTRWPPRTAGCTSRGTGTLNWPCSTAPSPR